MLLTGYDLLRKRRKGENTYRENRQNHHMDFTHTYELL